MPYFGCMLNYGKRFLVSASAILLVAVSLSSCYVTRAYRFRKFELEDVHKLPSVPLAPSATPFRFRYDTTSIDWLSASLDKELGGTGSYAFILLRNDTILYERYFGEVKESSQLPSFSAAKSFTSTLVGIALNEGHIKNLQQPITDYLPELRKQDGRFDAVTIQHVLDMRSGVESSENYSSPFSDVIRMGFNNNVSRTALKTGIEKAPGDFDYKSVNTQLLALVVEKATNRKLQDYAAEKLWQPLGMEHPATWNADKHNTVRAFCCMNAAARDYAKFGLLFLNKGVWQGKQLVPEEWVNGSVSADTMRKYDGYRNQWWAEERSAYFDDSASAVAFRQRRPDASVQKVTSKSGQRWYKVFWSDGEFHAQGILDQFVYVNPKKRLVIVRLGHYWAGNGNCEEFIYRLGARL